MTSRALLVVASVLAAAEVLAVTVSRFW